MHSQRALPLHPPAPTLATRRQFLGYGAVGLALAHGARSATQVVLPYSTLRFTAGGSLCPEDYFNVNFHLQFGSMAFSKLLKAGPDTPDCTLRDYSPKFSPQASKCALTLLANSRRWPDGLGRFDIADIQPERTYPIDLVTPRGSSLRATLTTTLIPGLSYYPNTSGLSITIRQP